MPADSDDVLTRVLHEILDVRRVVEDRIDSLEAKVDSNHREVLATLDAFAQRIERVESELQALSAAVRRLELSSVRDAEIQAELRRALDKLKSEVAELEERIAQLESDRHDA